MTSGVGFAAEEFDLVTSKIGDGFDSCHFSLLLSGPQSSSGYCTIEPMTPAAETWEGFHMERCQLLPAELWRA